MKKRRIHRKKGKKPKFSVGGIFFRVTLFIFAFCLVISYLSIFIDPDKFSIPMFFGFYFIPLLIINLILFLIALFHGSKSLFIPLLALLPSLFFTNLFYRTGTEEKAYGGNEYKVMTYNVGRFSAGEKGMPKVTVSKRISDFCSTENPDILCLQEFMIRDTSSIRTMMTGYPYRYYHLFKGDNFFGNITFSKYPILDSGALTFKKSTNLCIWSDIRLDNRIIRLFNCHLESYSISFTSIIKRLSKNGEFSNEFAKFHDRLKGGKIRRSEQVNALIKELEMSKKATLICGDFNDTPVSYTYHKLVKGKKDSFKEGGKGFSATYSMLWPLLRIDYILLPEEFDADRNVTQRVPFSDHYPVSTCIYCK